MNDLTRQQLCAALGISESTVRRLELLGLPCTPGGSRAKRYNLPSEWRPPLPVVMDLYLAHADKTAKYHALRCGPWCEGKKASQSLANA